jgi:hypothetical protein
MAALLGRARLRYLMVRAIVRLFPACARRYLAWRLKAPSA